MDAVALPASFVAADSSLTKGQTLRLELTVNEGSTELLVKIEEEVARPGDERELLCINIFDKFEKRPEGTLVVSLRNEGEDLQFGEWIPTAT